MGRRISMVFLNQQQHQYGRYQFPPQMGRSNDKNGLRQTAGILSGSHSPIANLARKGFGDLSKTLSNVDQVIKVVQSATPIVQEYGPMVKNLPAMYRIVKALSKVDSDDIDHTDTKASYEDKATAAHSNEENRHIISGQSIPKLYI